MTRLRTLGRTLAALAATALLAACGGAGMRGPATAAAVAPPAGELDAITTLLNHGDQGQARKRLRALLKSAPNDATAQLLLDSIERDPVELLGPTSFAYTSRPGDTFLALAQRFLGNRLKFYQLARYNKSPRPDSLATGTMLRIPGEPPRPAPSRPEPRAEAPRPVSKPKPAPAAAAAPTPVRNPAAAVSARAAGLAALNQGRVAVALTQLRRAASLDPGNPAITRDLTRATRIAQAVRAKR